MTCEELSIFGEGIVRRHTFLLFLLVFANNLALAHDDPQTQAWRELSTAHDAWDDARQHVTYLLIWKVDVKGELRVARYAQADNREDYRDNIIGMLRALSIDPLNVASNAATEIALLTADITDSIALDAAVSKAESMLSHVNSTLSIYGTEASTRLTYYNNKKKAYEDQYGSVDPNAPPTLPAPNNCVRGDACTKIHTDPASPGNPEDHQLPCPHRIDGLFFGLGERDCPGHIYSCDPNYQCSRWGNTCKQVVVDIVILIVI